MKRINREASSKYNLESCKSAERKQKRSMIKTAQNNKE